MHNDDYCTLESSNNELQDKGSRLPYVIWAPRKFYGKVAHNKQKKAYGLCFQWKQCAGSLREQ